MGRADFLKWGDYNVRCDKCGFKRKASECRMQWDNLFVCRECFDVRHPQDFVRGVPDDQTVPIARPDTDSGAGSIVAGPTAAGTVTAGTPAMGSTTVAGVQVVEDYDLEHWTENDLVHWTEIEFGTSTIEKESTTVYSGSYSCKVNVSVNGNQVGIVRAVSYVVGREYTITLALYGDGTNSMYISDDFDDVGGLAETITPTAAWAEYSYSWTANSQSDRIQITNTSMSAPAGVPAWAFYIDSISITHENVGGRKNDTVINLVSDAGISDGDPIGIVMDNGATHWTFSDGTPSVNVIPLGSYLPYDAAAGNTVYLPSINNETYVTATGITAGSL